MKCNLCDMEVDKCIACDKVFEVGDTIICFQHNHTDKHACDSECMYDYLSDKGDAEVAEVVKD